MKVVRSLNHTEHFFIRLVSHNNAIPIVTIRLEKRINNELFKKAVSFVIKHNDLFHSTVTKLNGKYFLKYTNRPSVKYEYKESNKILLHNDIEVNEVSRLDSYILFIILNNLKNSSEIVLYYNHSLFDGLSVNNIMNDIYKSYTALTKNEPLRIYKNIINNDLSEISKIDSSNKIIYDHYYSFLKISTNIIFSFIETVSLYYLENYLKYISHNYQTISPLLTQINFYKKFQINSFDKLNYLKKNKNNNDITYLSSVKFIRSDYRSVSKLCFKHNTNIFSYLCSLLADVLHTNYSIIKKQKLNILTFLNLRNHKNFSFTFKNQGLLICPYFLNLNCSQKNNIWKLSRNVFDEYSAFSDKVSLYDINEIYRMGNEAFELFYKSYLDLSKFDSNHIDIMVNNLGVIKQFENIKIKKYETLIFNRTDLLPKINLYFITNQIGDLFLSLSSSYIHKSDHKNIFNEIVDRFKNISTEKQ